MLELRQIILSFILWIKITSSDKIFIVQGVVNVIEQDIYCRQCGLGLRLRTRLLLPMMQVKIMPRGRVFIVVVRVDKSLDKFTASGVG